MKIIKCLNYGLIEIKNECAVAELFYYGCFPFNAFEINMIEFLK